jgi:hypothetical protein
MIVKNVIFLGDFFHLYTCSHLHLKEVQVILLPCTQDLSTLYTCLQLHLKGVQVNLLPYMVILPF